MKDYLLTTLRFGKLLTKGYFRDKLALFFTFIFPLIFLFIFGTINRNDRGVSFDLAIINQANTAFSNQFVDQIKQSDFVKVKDTNSTEDAKAKMSQGGVDTILLLPPDFGMPNQIGQPQGRAIVYYDPANPQNGQSFAAIVEATLNDINQQITGQQPLLVVEQQSTDAKGLSAFDYVFAGLMGFSILGLGIFGPTQGIPVMKKQGVLRRLHTTPLRTSQLMIAMTISYLAAGIVTIASMFVVGMLVFDFHMQGDYLSFFLITLLGILTMFGFGLAIGGWAKTENQAAPLTNLIAFPMMFLSGTFFPRFLMPEWLQTVSTGLPLTPVIDGIRKIIVEGQTILEIGPQLALIGGWMALIYFIASRVFRWE